MSKLPRNQRPDGSEGYYAELLAVHASCDRLGLVFAHEMTWACRAFRVVCGEPIDPEAGDTPPPTDAADRTPAVRLLETIMHPSTPAPNRPTSAPSADGPAAQSSRAEFHSRCRARGLDPAAELATLGLAWLLLDKVAPAGGSVADEMVRLLLRAPPAQGPGPARPSPRESMATPYHSTPSPTPKPPPPPSPSGKPPRSDPPVQLTRAAARGRDAHASGLTRDACPYQGRQGGYRAAWLGGYDAAEDESKKNTTAPTAEKPPPTPAAAPPPAGPGPKADGGAVQT